MQREMHLSIFLLVLIFVYNVSAYVINEYRHSTRDIEIRNPHPDPSTVDYSVLVYDKQKNFVYHENIAGIPIFGGLRIITFYLQPSQDDQLLILIYKFGNNNFPYSDVGVTGHIIDSFVYLPNLGDVSVFGDKVPLWDPAVSISYGPTISRCFSDHRGVPDYFVASFDTINGLNDCNQFPSVNTGGDDPHFVQSVIDMNSGQTINICYDVFGKGNQSIFVLRDKVLDVSVRGVLLDDYYFHRIFVAHDGKIIEINTKSIIVKQDKFPWAKNQMFYLEDGEIIFDDENKLRIEFSEKDLTLTVNIFKSKNDFGVEHLDVTFEGMNAFGNRQRFGGLIGDIQQSNFALVQGDRKKRKKRGVIVNGRKITGILEKRLSRSCFLLPVKYLIQPKKLNYYVN